jgi:hypothetical protein
MIKPFKSKKDLARELQIHPKTLSRYMQTLGIKWSKKPMPPQIWERVLRELHCDDEFPEGGGRENSHDLK